MRMIVRRRGSTSNSSCMIHQHHNHLLLLFRKSKYNERNHIALRKWSKVSIDFLVSDVVLLCCLGRSHHPALLLDVKCHNIPFQKHHQHVRYNGYTNSTPYHSDPQAKPFVFRISLPVKLLPYCAMASSCAAAVEKLCGSCGAVRQLGKKKLPAMDRRAHRRMQYKTYGPPSKRSNRRWSDARTVGWSHMCRVELTWVRASQMHCRTLMSIRCHMFCLHDASTHLKSTRTSARHASTVPPLVNPTAQPSSRQLHGCQLRWTYENTENID